MNLFFVIPQYILKLKKKRMINQLSDFILEFRKLYDVKYLIHIENEDDNLVHLTK